MGTMRGSKRDERNNGNEKDECINANQKRSIIYNLVQIFKTIIILNNIKLLYNLIKLNY